MSTITKGAPGHFPATPLKNDLGPVVEKKFTYFISSTFNDLIEERKAIANYILKIDEIPIGMEQFGAVDQTQWEYITRLIDTSDYFILIVAGRYGSIDDDDSDKISYTHKEFRYAVAKGIPIIRILHKNPEILPQKFTETDPIVISKLEAFRSEVQKSALAAYYTDPQQLLTEVAVSISKAKALFKRPGWIRDNGFSDSPGLVQTKIELDKCEEEVSKLRTIIAAQQAIIDKFQADNTDFAAVFENNLGTVLPESNKQDDNRSVIKIEPKSHFHIDLKYSVAGRSITTVVLPLVKEAFLIVGNLISANKTLGYENNNEFGHDFALAVAGTWLGHIPFEHSSVHIDKQKFREIIDFMIDSGLVKIENGDLIFGDIGGILYWSLTNKITV